MNKPDFPETTNARPATESEQRAAERAKRGHRVIVTHDEDRKLPPLPAPGYLLRELAPEIVKMSDDEVVFEWENKIPTEFVLAERTYRLVLHEGNRVSYVRSR